MVNIWPLKFIEVLSEAATAVLGSKVTILFLLPFIVAPIMSWVFVFSSCFESSSLYTLYLLGTIYMTLKKLAALLIAIVCVSWFVCVLVSPPLDVTD